MRKGTTVKDTEQEVADQAIAPPGITGEDEDDKVLAITTRLVTVTPDMARQWLDNMAPNRKVSRVNLENLMKAMEEKRWHQDASPIKFNRNGQLIDGQHRLWALINTGQTHTFIVAWGVLEEAMTTLDTGKMRSRGDVLAIHDPALTDINSVAATTTIILRWKKGERNNNLRNSYVSNDEVIAFYDQERDDIIAASRHGRRLANATRAASGQAYSLCWYLFSNIDPEDAEFFWDRIVDGAALEPGSPIYALRELLAREARSAGTRERMRADIAAALMIKAWNAYRRGEEVKLLHFKVGGAHPDRYPEPI